MSWHDHSLVPVEEKISPLSLFLNWNIVDINRILVSGVPPTDWCLHTLENDDCKSAATAKLLQSCLTLCNPIDSSQPGFPIPGILQARTLEWVAISFSNAWKWKVKVKSLSHVRLLATRWTAAFQAPPSMGFSRQEYWSGLLLPSPDCKSSYHLFPYEVITVLLTTCLMLYMTSSWLIYFITGGYTS